MENIEADFGAAIRFIASGRVVLSNSYHGVYWGLLLGKKVLCVPFSNKFYNYRINPGYASGPEWFQSLDKAQGSDEMLDLCRDGAAAFESKARDILHGQR